MRSDAVHALRRGNGGEAPARVAAATQDEDASLAGRRLLCAACRHPVTSDAQRIHVNDRHEHSYVNPDGVRFYIGCFRDAPGCTPYGAPTMEFTWFPGFAWNYALCSGCGTLLGWRYHGADASFFGFILNRLVPEPTH